LLLLGFLVPPLHLARDLFAAAPPQKLVKIRVVGSKRFQEALIVRASGLKLGAQATPKTFKEAANKLAATAAFTDVTYRYQATGAGFSVVFRVTDASNFLPCRFTNFVWFSETELQEALRSRVPLFTGEIPLTGSLPDQVDEALRRLLKSRGIPGTVHHTLYGHKDGPIQAIQFRVRGTSIPIRRVEFEGATRVDTRALQAAVQLLLGTDYDQSFVSDFAANNISPLYWERGYLQVVFGDPRAVLTQEDAPGTSVAVTIPVREGARYRLAEIHWSGNQAFASTDLDKYIRLHSGELANAVELQRNLEGVQGAYAARGFLHVTLQARPTLAVATRTVTYELQVHEGDLYRMGKLEITGLDSSHTLALKKHCQLQTGDPYDKDYWHTFISARGRYLPQTSRGWTIGFRQSINESTKTVDVTISFAPK
jgi:outer membrane protein assembly factor BamA